MAASRPIPGPIEGGINVFCRGKSSYAAGVSPRPTTGSLLAARVGAVDGAH